MKNSDFQGIMDGLDEVLDHVKHRKESRKRFMVTGGVFTDTTFENVLVHTIENYGPFKTYDEALTVWSGKARAQIDICCHRLFIQEL